MRYAGLNGFGRTATRLAAWLASPHKEQVKLAKFNPIGFISPGAEIYHSNLQLGANVYIGDRVVIYEANDGGPVKLGDRTCLLRDTIIETGSGGQLIIGADTYVHPRCQFNAYKGDIEIGCGVMIAANCTFYPHDHGMAPGQPIREQPLQTKGPIIVGDNAWLGTGVVVLGGVTIGEGAVIGAGSVVTASIPDNAIAVGSPARVVKSRNELARMEFEK